jgi:hypothetical protein
MEAGQEYRNIGMVVTCCTVVFYKGIRFSSASATYNCLANGNTTATAVGVRLP